MLKLKDLRVKHITHSIVIATDSQGYKIRSRQTEETL